MKKALNLIFSIFMLHAQITQAAFLQQLTQAQEALGIRVATPQDLQFESRIKNLSAQLALGLSPSNISQANVNSISSLLNAFYALFFDPECIRFGTRENMNDFFEQLKNWHDALKKKNMIIAWQAGTDGQELKNLLVQGLKEICMFGRYSKHKEENLVTFKIRVQYILTSFMMDSCFKEWKDQLITNNELFSLGAFYSWEAALLKSEFKDSAALIPLFNKIAGTVDAVAEQKAAQQHAQELAVEKQMVEQRKQQDMQKLHNMIIDIQGKSPMDPAGKGALYLDYIKVLIDPAYIDVSLKDRQAIDKINDQFKNMHSIIGRTFMPMLSQEELDALKFSVAKALELIHSTAAKKMGGVAFKNHVEFVLKTLMTIQLNQTPTEDQIKFQWIKPLYLNNPFLTAEMKKKLLDIFNNANFQRWQVGARNLTLQLASSAEPVAAEPMIRAVRPLPAIPSATPEVMPVASEVMPMVMPEVMPVSVQPAMPEVMQEVAPRVAPISAPPVVAMAEPSPISVGVSDAGKNLIGQALVAPVSAIQNSLANVTLGEKFDLMRMVDDAQYTAVHQAASLGRADVLKLLFQGLTPHQKFEIVKMRQDDGQTALHLAASAKSAPTKGFNPMAAVTELLHGLTLQQKIELIKMQDTSGETALDIAEGSGKKAMVITFKEIMNKG